MVRPRRPALLGPVALDSFDAGGDPAQREAIAQRTARLLVEGSRSTDDEAVVQRLVGLADEHGLEVLAELWADAPAETLAGALWRLYLLRQWVHQDPVSAAREYDRGRLSAPVAEVVAGVGDPPGPGEVRELADAVLTGLARGDVATTFERAAAFARVVAAGRAESSAEDEDEAPRLAAVRLVRTAEQLEAAAAAHRWPVGDDERPPRS